MTSHARKELSASPATGPRYTDSADSNPGEAYITTRQEIVYAGRTEPRWPIPDFLAW